MDAGPRNSPKIDGAADKEGNWRW